MCCRRLCGSWYKNFYVSATERASASARTTAGTGSGISAQGDHCGGDRGGPGGDVLRRVSPSHAPLRQFRSLSLAAECDDLWGVVVSALRRTEKMVRRLFRVCALYRVRRARRYDAGTAGVQGCRYQALSYLAISTDR